MLLSATTERLCRQRAPNGNADVAQLLLKHGANAIAPECSILQHTIIAAAANRYALLVELLVGCSSAASNVCGNASTAHHPSPRRLWSGQLLVHGAAVNVRRSDSTTLLITTVHERDSVELLLARGADEHAAKVHGMALHAVTAAWARFCSAPAPAQMSTAQLAATSAQLCRRPRCV